MRGFSLVELSIVLVILGLLTGGILAGQSLIKASELRALTAEYQRYTTATYTFRDKYLAVPGDMASATRFWSRHANQAWCVTNSSASVTTPGTCDGNSNNALEAAGAASQSGEEFQFWRQLSLAGLIEGNYTGLAGTGAADDLDPSINLPASKFTNAIWRVYSMGSQANAFTLTYDVVMVSGLNDQGTAILTPEQLWNIDTKMDDGKPAYGRIIARPWSGCTTAANATDYAATYSLSSTATPCLMIVPRLFSQ